MIRIRWQSRRHSWRGPLQVLALLAGLLLASPAAATEERALVAAASDLQFALEAVAARFQEESGQEVRLSFGSSGNFARQIRQGAGFELFLSADEAYVEMLADAGLTQDEGVLYALGRLVIIVPGNSSVKADAELNELEAALEDGRLRRFAIANPEHAPYGARAAEVLRHKGLWEAIQPALILGENVSQAAQFAVSGNAEGGLVAYSLARSTALSERGDSALLPESWHSPLRQRMVLMKGAGPTAQAFYAYLQQPEARRILADYGFELPPDMDEKDG
ncbi:molybdate ABC transporter substrate-binding protein [Fodinicurvata fenggangensis]|uniref:molybdate ABC transporter substrate-binding protein n=1 Tax=Fodinicurvata fenggangensis TaxID=1121830 RepID=UPI0009DF5161|nr:molybdate ABC transporter substrate-binding protein [Fodinicurvata fenggangensis]